ncbi:MAG: phosphatase PAP2 family protein [Halanaeroarchaeum sp.]
MRGVGVTALVAEVVPEAAVPVLVVLTGLGDPAFLTALVVIVYVFGPRYHLLGRRAGATVVAITFLALSATVFLKYGFAMARPPPEIMLIAEDGAGFPSGHATGAAATYVGLAAYLDRWSRSTRYRLAGFLVVLVALTRVLLGVHYLVDVVAGTFVGLLAVVAVRWVSRDGLTKAFAMAIPLAVGGTLLAVTVENALVAGLVSGATLGWWLAAERDIDVTASTGKQVAGLVVGAILVAVGYESGIPVVAGLAGAGSGSLFLAAPGLDP